MEAAKTAPLRQEGEKWEKFMNIAVILGSPRLESNSEKLARAAAKAVAGPNDTVEYFKLNDLRYRGCQGCYSCKTKTDFCIIKDDMTRVLGSVAAGDLVILTSPIYIGEITSQVKGFIDRSFSWYKPDFITNSEPSRLKSGKKLILIVTQGNPDRNIYKRNIDYYTGYFTSHYFKVTPFVVPVGEGDLGTRHPKVFEEIASLAKSI
jgi:multimeric flavodoxin WrbA